MDHFNDGIYGDSVAIQFNERACRALLGSVNWTLERWGGQMDEGVDQDALFQVRHTLRSAVLEFDFGKNL